MKERKVSSGNPNPSPATRFGAGEKANPQGKTSEQKKNEMRASELASKMTVDMMEAFVKIAGNADEDGEIAGLLSADLVNLIKEANNRAHGTPKASVDLTSEDGSMSAPNVIQIVGKQDDSDG